MNKERDPFKINPRPSDEYLRSHSVFLVELDIAPIDPLFYANSATANAIATLMLRNGLDPTQYLYHGSGGAVRTEQLIETGHDKAHFDGTIYCSALQVSSKGEWEFTNSSEDPQRTNPINFTREHDGITLWSRISIFDRSRLQPLELEYQYMLPENPSKALVGVITLRDSRRPSSWLARHQKQ